MIQYHINHRAYTKKQLLAFCRNAIVNPDLEKWEQSIYRFIEEWFSTSPKFTTKTSGSTGPPRNIHIQKSRAITSANISLKHFQLKPQQTALLCLPASSIAGKMMIVRSFIGGLNLLTQAPGRLPLIQEKIDFCAMVPLQVQACLEQPECFHLIQKMIVGGAPCSDELIDQLHTLPTQIWETYGMTETLSHIAVRKLNPPPVSTHFSALTGTHFTTDDRTCLTVHAPHLSCSHIQTNDLAELSDSTHFRFIGRIDQLINSGGVKINPLEIEKTLLKVIKYPLIISSVPDPKWGEKLVLAIEKPSSDTTSKNEILSICKKLLPAYHKPKTVVFFDAFPLLKNQKIDRIAIQQRISQKINH